MLKLQRTKTYDEKLSIFPRVMMRERRELTTEFKTLLHLKLALIVVRILYINKVLNYIVLLCEGESKIWCHELFHIK